MVSSIVIKVPGVKYLIFSHARGAGSPSNGQISEPQQDMVG